MYLPNHGPERKSMPGSAKASVPFATQTFESPPACKRPQRGGPSGAVAGSADAPRHAFPPPVPRCCTGGRRGGAEVESLAPTPSPSGLSHYSLVSRSSHRSGNFGKTSRSVRLSSTYWLLHRTAARGACCG
jgi:hypothetical protein